MAALKISRAVSIIPKFAPVFSSSSERILRPSPPPKLIGEAAVAPQTEERGRWSKLPLFIPGAIAFALGTWQIFRRQEKIKMLDYRKGRLDMEPIRWNEIGPSGQSLDSLEFRKVICEGVFDEGKALFVGPRSRSISGVTENGYYVISPLIPTAGKYGSVQQPILVNRGWVPRDWRNRSSKDSRASEKSSDSEIMDIRPNGGRIWWKFWSQKPKLSKDTEPREIPIEVVGVVRGSEKPSIFVPENDPQSGQWFYVNIPMMARACSLPADTLYIEDVNENASAADPYPVPKEVNSLIRYSVMPQDHLNYTLTWYSLSSAVTFMAFKRIRPKKKVQR
ncbi:surfeit locus protein 1-like isoform X2 [Phalaenopsis equestris]|uniref:surfeit locus protein 1-like isoform X2 n=1 Tax=Phalaenopsis equestris TaxID=78828 RepID=UPI0009E238CE|nr:surfeit locus protein 1-like isoform X2 [Phalaenopsis equestris]